MTTANGQTDGTHRSSTTSPNLRKRKRSASPEKPNKVSAKVEAPAVQQSIDNVVRELRRHDIGPKLLRSPSSIRPSNVPPTKRLRSNMAEQTIESRIAAGSYTSLPDFLDDIKQATDNILEDEEEDKLNVNIVDKIVSQYQQSEEEERPKTSPTNHIPSEALSLRGTVEGGGMRQLFSGLRRRPLPGMNVEEIDAKTLPNGFEIVEAATLDPSRGSTKEVRNFGDVFRPHRNLKSLELPRSSYGSRRTILDFVHPLDEWTPANKHDFKYQSLHSGSWLSYSTDGHELRRKQSTPSTLNESEKKSQALFKASYSSFAPSYDNTDALIPNVDRSRQWWRKYGSSHPLLSGLPQHHDDSNVELSEFSEENLEKDVEDYEEEHLEDAIYKNSTDKSQGEGEQLLSQISELLQTLSSYQFLRDAEKKQNPGSTQRPTDDEFSTYELLKTQLKLLVELLPPFAVAKLDGDQLNALNIDTKILVKVPEFAGTGQADEYTLRRNRAAQAQQVSTIGRTASTPQTAGRAYPGAALPHNSYNTQVRAYNANATTPAYTQRPGTALYNTPRPGTQGAQAGYMQTPYRPQQPPPNATIQQYQRALQNGYNQHMAQPYGQRTTQTNYQPQTPAQYARSDSPQKPLTNGQTPAYQQRPYGSLQPGTPSNQASVPAHATIQQFQAMERLKAQQAQQEAQRQASGTPQPTPEVNGKVTTPVPDSQTPSSELQAAATEITAADS